MLKVGLKKLFWVGLLVGIILISLTLTGTLSIRWGIWPFLIGVPVTALSVIWLSLLVFYQYIETRVFMNGFKYLSILGSTGVIAGLFLLGGVYINNLLSGHMQSKWILFWPMIFTACIVFWVGVYRKIIKRNLDTFYRWECFLERKDTEPHAFLKRLLADIVLQKPLRQESKIRWLRHILIYWGFVLLWVTDMSFAFLFEYLPILGFPQFSKIPGIRTVFKFFLESFGFMILLGTSVALIWGYSVRKTNKKVYTDTPTATFLFFVVLTGYCVEGARFASISYNPSMEYSFIGNFIASLFRGKGLPYTSIHQWLWYLHVILSSSFIAYFPIKRLIHSCATPVGKLMQSQKLLLEKKVIGVVSGLLQPKK